MSQILGGGVAPKIVLPQVEIGAFPWEDLKEVLDAVKGAEGGNGKVAAVAKWLADEIDWRQVIPGPVGEVIESVDDLAPKFVALLAKIAPFRKRGK